MLLYVYRNSETFDGQENAQFLELKQIVAYRWFLVYSGEQKEIGSVY